MNPKKLALVEWVDSSIPDSGAVSWTQVEDIKSCGISYMKSIGWIWSQEGEGITLVPHMGSTLPEVDNVRGMITIPRECITSISYFTEFELLLKSKHFYVKPSSCSEELKEKLWPEGFKRFEEIV
jgi:hypothetical protein